MPTNQPTKTVIYWTACIVKHSSLENRCNCFTSRVFANGPSDHTKDVKNGT